MKNDRGGRKLPGTQERGNWSSELELASCRKEIAIRAVIPACLLLPASVALLSGQAPESKVDVPKPIQQPIPFSHKKHCDAGMDCAACHKLGQKGDVEGIPSADDCMVCHQTINVESPEIGAVAKFEKEGKPIPWVRIYILQDFVVFSHQQHLDAKEKCEECHGQVSSRDVLAKEKDFIMKTCITCHRSHKASIACDLCHKLSM